MAQQTSISAADRGVAEDAARERRHHAADSNDADTPLTIGEVAREFGVTLRALRFYEAKRLIAPERSGSVRLYRRSDRARIALILTGRRLGFTLSEIKALVGKPGGEDLHLTREQCVAQINLLEQQKRGIELAIAELRQICTSFYKKLIESGDARPRASNPSHSR